MGVDGVVGGRYERRGLVKRLWDGAASLFQGEEVVVVTRFVGGEGPAALED